MLLTILIAAADSDEAIETVRGMRADLPGTARLGGTTKTGPLIISLVLAVILASPVLLLRILLAPWRGGRPGCSGIGSDQHLHRICPFQSDTTHRSFLFLPVYSLTLPISARILPVSALKPTRSHTFRHRSQKG